MIENDDSMDENEEEEEEEDIKEKQGLKMKERRVEVGREIYMVDQRE